MGLRSWKRKEDQRKQNKINNKKMRYIYNKIKYKLDVNLI